VIHITESELKRSLIESGFISEEDFTSAAKESSHFGRDIKEVLIEKGMISEEYLIKILCDYFKVPFFDISSEKVPKELLELIPESLAKTSRVIPVKVDDHSVTLAMEDPGDLKIIQLLEHKLQKKIQPVFVTKKGLKEALSAYKVDVSKEFDKVINENIEKAIGEGAKDAEKMAEDIPIIEILDNIIEYAVSKSASDIHIEPLEKEVLVRFRVDGILEDLLTAPDLVMPAILARVKLISDLRIDEHRLPQDGRFKFKNDDLAVAIRVSIVPTIYGEKIVMRLLSESSRPKNFESLGFESDQLKTLEEEIKKSHGMILSTGPTGSGKTTTLYTVMHLLNRPEVNISTIEDPVEYDVGRINQIQVNTKTGLTFADGLRSLLRQDPDIIMVGEIRDKETAELAVHAALTGHLVLSTLHTNNAAGTIARITDIGIQPFLLSSTINLIIAQRLVRRVCPHCVASNPISKEDAKDIFLHLGITYEEIEKLKLPNMVYKGKGCKECHDSGYKGQVGLFEMLKVDEKIRKLIVNGVSEAEIEIAAKKNGMKTMLEDGLKKAAAGITTYEEIMRVTRE